MDIDRATLQEVLHRVAGLAELQPGEVVVGVVAQVVIVPSGSAGRGRSPVFATLGENVRAARGNAPALTLLLQAKRALENVIAQEGGGAGLKPSLSNKLSRAFIDRSGHTAPELDALGADDAAELHRALDQLAAHYQAQSDRTLEQTSVKDLLEWSHAQTLPSRKGPAREAAHP